jgi:regulator of sigma E protease
MIGWYVIGVLGLALLMVVHEGGHFLAARAYGMRVTKFSIGFGPTFFKIVPRDGYFWFTTAGERIRVRMFRHDPEKHGPTVYQVAMIPFVAYVQVAGMNPLEDIDPADKGSYANASLLGRVLTIFGGPFANYAFASVLFFLSFFFGGRVFLSTEFNVIDGRPAAAAHLENGDKIVEIDGVAVREWEQMADIIAKHPGQDLTIVVDRKGQRVTAHVTPANDGGRGKIGVEARGAKKIDVSAKEAAVLAMTKPPMVVRDLVVGIAQYFTGKAEGELSGPAGIVKETARAAKSGWTDLLYFLGALSAYLGAFNLIPFPALDGGRLMFLGYEAATRRRPNARIEAHIHAIGLVMMLGLMVYVTVANDFHLGGAK